LMRMRLGCVLAAVWPLERARAIWFLHLLPSTISSAAVPGGLAPLQGFPQAGVVHPILLACRAAGGSGPSAGGSAARLEEPLTALAELRGRVVIDGVQRRPAAAVQVGRA
jgi:hypothetical protein